MKLCALLLAASPLFAQSTPPALTNARFETRALTGALDSALQLAAGPAWFGYAVAAIPGDQSGCCYDNNAQSACPLEGNGGRILKAAGSTPPIPLEPGNTFVVLLRVENHSVKRIRGYSQSCALDAGGLPFLWLTGVSADESLRYLTAIVNHTGEPLARDAEFAIAQHGDPRATGLLTGFATAAHPQEIREQAIFWLGASRGASALPALKELVSRDPSEQIRDKAVFALSISKDPAGLDTLIDAARHDSSPHVRGQALFWLAQKAGKRSESVITDAVANDPDTEVKKKAVFALSQLPKEEAVPKLMEVARNQKNPEVRKQAFFWLGQSNDPRALAFIEQVLKN